MLAVLLLAVLQQVPTFGQPLLAPDGVRRAARFSLFTEGMLDRHPALVRRATYASSSTLQTGAFPAPARGDEEPVELRVRYAIDAAGNPTRCQVIVPSGKAAFDAHACPHLLKHLRHVPALDWDGKRVGDAMTARIRYRFDVVPTPVSPSLSGRPAPMIARVEPRPLQPIDAAALGLAERDVPVQVTGVSGGVMVEPDGRVSACNLVGATEIDAIDLRVCRRLRAMAFAPVIDRDGRAIAARYSFRAAR